MLALVEPLIWKLMRKKKFLNEYKCNICPQNVLERSFEMAKKEKKLCLQEV